MICHDFLMKNVAFCIEKMIKIVSIFSWSKLQRFGRSKFWLYLNNRKLIYPSPTVVRPVKLTSGGCFGLEDDSEEKVKN